MIKIISKKKYDGMQAEIGSLRQEKTDLMGQHENLHNLHQGLWKRFNKEIEQRDKRIESLQQLLRREVHANAEMLKKLKKLEKKGAGK